MGKYQGERIYKTKGSIARTAMERRNSARKKRHLHAVALAQIEGRKPPGEPNYETEPNVYQRPPRKLLDTTGTEVESTNPAPALGRPGNPLIPGWRKKGLVMTIVGTGYLRNSREVFSAQLEYDDAAEGEQFESVTIANGIPGMVAVLDVLCVRLRNIDEPSAFDSCGVTVAVTTQDEVSGGPPFPRYVAAAQASARFEAATPVLLRPRENDNLIFTDLGLAGLRTRRPAEPWMETTTGPFGAPGKALSLQPDPVPAAEGGTRGFIVQVIGHYEPVTEYRVTLKSTLTMAGWYARRDNKWCATMTSNSAGTDLVDFTRPGFSHRLEHAWSNGRIRTLLASDFAVLGAEDDGEPEAVMDRVVTAEPIGSRLHRYPVTQPTCGATIRMEMTPGGGAVGLGWISGSYAEDGFPVSREVELEATEA